MKLEGLGEGLITSAAFSAVGVVVFGIAVGPLGAVSLLLVILQPVLFHAWCTLCLSSALVSVLMIGPAMDELLASLQVLVREHRAGRSVWRAFWKGTD